ncbi:MAG: DegV family protein [Oscillospiraceae bacterium]|nr:DegV family protein [Oscillospiraceae bacterium]
MAYKLIADSGCDTTEEIRERLNLTLVPLRIMLSTGKEFTDTLDLNISDMLDEMNESGGLKTNCPSVTDYAKYMYGEEECLVVTIASFLSGSYNSALAARDMVLEEFPDKKIHIFDSLNASAGELRLTLYIHELIEEGCDFDEIVKRGEEFAENVATVLVLEDLGNLIKNGRISKLAEKVANILSINPVLYKRNFNEIRMAAKPRGLKNALNRMIEYIREWTESKPKHSLTLTLSHCEAPERAVAVKQRILETCPAIGEIVVAPTSGLSSVYANRGGIIASFEAEPAK